MCKETPLMKFCKSFEDDKHMSELQNLVSDRINFAVEQSPNNNAAKSEIYRIIVDEMFEYHTNVASRNGRLTQNNLFPTVDERKQFADVAIYNRAVQGLIKNELTSEELQDEQLKVYNHLTELQNKEETNRKEKNQIIQNEK